MTACRKLCDEYIVGATVWSGTYCKLPAGHAGSHSMHYPPETVDTEPVPAPSDAALRDAIAAVEQQVMQAQNVPWATETDAATAYATTAVETAYAVDLPRLLADAERKGRVEGKAAVVVWLRELAEACNEPWVADMADAIVDRFNPEADDG